MVGKKREDQETLKPALIDGKSRVLPSGPICKGEQVILSTCPSLSLLLAPRKHQMCHSTTRVNGTHVLVVPQQTLSLLSGVQVCSVFEAN